ncbi:hypothetical protein FACS189490_04270 [Clostridia bacterium]|nr:hypothetical protein FACS189490_04270 [Clostridia bacterium]
MLGVKDAPSEINSVASHHSGVCPVSAVRHWNLGFCERLKHGTKVSPSRVTGTERTWDVFPDRVFGVFAICSLPHFVDYSYSLVKQVTA